MKECDSCNFETEVKAYKYQLLRKEPKEMFLCELCAGTFAGNAAQYPTAYHEVSKDVLKAICYVGNVILNKIKETNRI